MPERQRFLAPPALLVALVLTGCSQATHHQRQRKPPSTLTREITAPRGTVLRGGTASIRVPDDWHATRLAPVGAITIQSAAAPSGTDSGTGVGVGSSIITSSLINSLEENAAATHPSAKVVAVGLADAMVATVVCRGAVARADCSQIASTMTGSQARAPSSTDRAAITAALHQAAAPLTDATQALTGARSQQDRATAARSVSESLRSEAGALQAAPVSTATRVTVLVVAQALDQLANAWGVYASSSARGAAEVARERAAVTRVEGATGTQINAALGPSAPAGD